MNDRYQIVKKIGQGGIGAVYEAFDTQLKRKVALKRVLTPDQASPQAVSEAAESLMQEATTMSTLNHPNIVSVYDVGRDDLGGFVVMELLAGETLDQTIAESVLTLEDFREVVNQTLEGLIAAQAADMLHRDLKPGNVMVIWRPSGKFQLKILDFGLAKVSQNPSKQTIDQGDAILGSIFFMAPEQFERAALTFASDLYAMGAIYYFTLTGKYPFNGPSAPAVMAAHLLHDVTSLEELRPDLPPEICQWVMWLINRNPEDRPQSAREALDLFPPPHPTGEVVMMAEVVPDAVPVARVLPVNAVSTPAPKRKVPAPPPAPVASVKPATGPVATVRKQTESYTIRADDSDEDEDEKNRKLKLLLIAGVSVGALIILIPLGLHLSKELSLAGFKKRIDALAVPNPEGTPKDVQLLAPYLSGDPKRSDSRALGILSSLKGPGVDEALVNELKSAPAGPIRIGLMRALAARGLTTAFDPVLAIYRSTQGEERAVAGETLQHIAKPGQESTLLSFLKDNVPNRPNLENAVINLIRQNKDVAGRTRGLLEELPISSGDYRKSLFRITGQAGGPESLERIGRLVSDKAEDHPFLSDLLLCLAVWPDRSAGPLLQQMMTNADAVIASEASRAYIRLLSMPAGGDDSTNWKYVLEKAPRGDALNVFESMADNPTSFTLAFLTSANLPGWERTFQQAQKSVEESAAAALPVQSGKLIPAAQAKPRGAQEGANFVQEGAYWTWTTPSTWFIWVLKLPKAGTYKLEVLCSAEQGGESEFIASLAGQTLKGTSVTTDSKTTFVPAVFPGGDTFQIKDNQVGVQVLGLQAGAVTKPRLMNFSGIKLTIK
jgi:serine/threonine protein kinase